jgi:hypothetical protein
VAAELPRVPAAPETRQLQPRPRDGVINVSHAGISVEDFQADAHAWLTTTEHPTSGLTYAGMTYQPMLELLRYLRDEDFTTYIVSGGGIDFIRAIAEEAYGIPPAQVVGSQGDTSYVPSPTARRR